MNNKVIFTAIVSMLLTLPDSTHAALMPRRSVLENGMILLTSEQRTLPMVSIEMLILAGSRFDGPKQEGLANLTAKLLTEGTKARSALQISQSLDFIGAHISTAASQDLASISMTVLKKDLITGLELLSEILTSSVFPQPEIERQKQAIIATIRAQEENPGEIAEKRFLSALYPQSPAGRPVEGSESSVMSISQSALRQFYNRYYRPNRTIMSVVGDVSHEELMNALRQPFKSWTKGEAAPGPLVPTKKGEPQDIRVNKELTQANIIVGHEGIARANNDYYAVQVMNYILGGGGFSSRAMDSVRNERGLAYSVYSLFDAEKGRGTFQFVMQTKNETAPEAIKIVKDEMLRMRQQPVSEAELSDAKDYLIGSFPLRFDTNQKVANFLAQVEYFELGLDYPERYAALIQKVTRDDVLRVAQKYLYPDKLISVVVGNQQKIAAKPS
jgi:zinc protease